MVKHYSKNQVIDVLAAYIRNKIVGEIKKTRLFSVLADEATDISNQEQMSLVLRFMNAQNEIKEEFVSIMHCKSGTSGEALSNMIENEVNKLG